MAFDSVRGKAVLFGGMAKEASGETWLWDGVSWSQVTPGTSPSPRSGHSMAFDEQRGEIVLFGGIGTDSTPATWIWNGTTWAQRTTAHNPGMRSGHAMAWDPVRKVVVLFGGSPWNSGISQLNDTWIWDGTDWTQLSPPNVPPVRSGVTLAWDSTRQVLILQGGSQLTSPDTWAWNGTTWTNLQTAGPAGGSPVPLFSHNGTVARVVAATETWNGSEWRPMVTTADPLSLFDVAVAWDSVRNRTILFGGSDGNTMKGQTWSFAIGNACTFTDSNYPAPAVVDWSGGTAQLAVAAPAGCSWTATTTDSWVTLNPNSSAGPGTVVASLAANTGVSSRRASVRIGGRFYYISQPEPPCPSNGAPVPSTPVLVRANCGAVTFSLSATAGERLTALLIQPTAFGGIPPNFGIQTAKLTIRGPLPSQDVLVNGSGAFVPASGFVTVPATGSYSVEITPSGSTLPWHFDLLREGQACVPRLVYFLADGSVQTVPEVLTPDRQTLSSFIAALPPGCPASTLAAPGWITPSVSTLAAGLTQMTVGIDLNFGGERTGSVTQAGSGATLLTARQQAASCSASLSPNAASVDAGRNTQNLRLTTSCSGVWKSYSDSSWLQVYPLSGTSSTDVRVTAFPNFGTAARSGTATVASLPYTVNQAPGTGTTLERYVKLLYFSFFGRLPSPAEVAFQASSGLSREQLASNFFQSQEFSLGGRFVAGLYVGILNRDAEFGGWLFQRDALTSGLTTQTTVVDNFIDSAEFQLKNGSLSDRAFVTLLYRQILLREPGDAEVDFQAGALTGGLSRSGLARNFLASQEFAIGTGPRLTAFLTHACLLQRDPTSAEFTAALNKMTQIQAVGDLTARQNAIRDQLLAPVANGGEINTILQ